MRGWSVSRSDLVLPDGRVLPKECFAVSFARSGGAGGQHVNKTESKVDLRLDLECARAVLGDGDVARIRQTLASRLDAAGRLVAICSEHKSQFQNYRAAQERMADWIARALVRRKRRVRTKPTRGSQRRRLDAKKRRGDLKRQRQHRPDRD
ncbi:MAG TPA: aminoacyl-tRNA hydrolase [bacterium]|nr:aminoacyl-tRNA hydrolase [bacterium]